MSGPKEVRLTIATPGGDLNAGPPWRVRIEGSGGTIERVFGTLDEAMACSWAFDAYGSAVGAEVAHDSRQASKATS